MNELQPRREGSIFPLFDRPLDEVFEGFFRPMRNVTALQGSNGFLSPAIDVTEHDDHFTVHAELPGFRKDDIHVAVDNGVLTISAETSSEKTQEDEGKPMIRERRYGRFVRSLSVGNDINADKVKASYKDGVLELTLPKTKPTATKTRRIAID
ncbi:MAG TPA: Hsp20/alpha crystallin family protein [Pseudomonadales bacterium]|nr:Hsp20/alpha crystallin family protein [Pseudomonadales bacterium]